MTSESIATPSNASTIVPALTADFDEKWDFLKHAIDRVMSGPEHSLPSAVFASFYTIVFNHCHGIKTRAKRRSGNRLMSELSF